MRAIARRQGASSYQLHETYPDGVAPPLTGHSCYGFNWHHLPDRVSHYLEVERTLFTPLGFLRGWVSSQAYFVCRPKD